MSDALCNPNDRSKQGFISSKESQASTEVWTQPRATSPGRHALYVCYQPAELATWGDLERKRMAYREQRLTTHWPAKNVVVAEATTTEEARRFIQIRSRARVRSTTAEPENRRLSLTAGCGTLAHEHTLWVNNPFVRHRVVLL